MYSHERDSDKQKKIIMVVDDSRLIRVVATKLLTCAGYEVIVANDGIDALSMLVERSPDLILLDVLMPNLDGFETCSLIKNHAAYKDIPIVILSGKGSSADHERGLKAGSELYLSKPFKHNSLISTVNKGMAMIST